MTVLQSNSDETFWMQFNHVGGHALRRRLVRLRRPRGPSWEEVGVQGLQCGSRKPKLDGSEQFRALVDKVIQSRIYLWFCVLDIYIFCTGCSTWLYGTRLAGSKSVVHHTLVPAYHGKRVLKTEILKKCQKDIRSFNFITSKKDLRRKSQKMLTARFELATSWLLVTHSTNWVKRAVMERSAKYGNMSQCKDYWRIFFR